MNQQQAALIVKLGMTDEQIGVMFPYVAPRHYGVVREWGEKGGAIMMEDAGNWVPFVGNQTPSFYNTFNYRLAPRTVTITGPGGTFEIPEPVREELKKGQVYWIGNFAGAYTLMWEGDNSDMWLLSQGRIHLTKEAAQAHADALEKLMGVQS